jgi:hypothetical protein
MNTGMAAVIGTSLKKTHARRSDSTAIGLYIESDRAVLACSYKWRSMINLGRRFVSI